MRYKCLVADVSADAFIEHSFVLPGQRVVCFLDDFKERPGYHHVSSHDIALVEKKSGKEWITMPVKIKASMSRRRNESMKIIRRDGDDEWDCIVLAAQEHQSTRYRNDSIPIEISLLSDKLALSAKNTSLHVLAQAKEIEDKITKVKQLFLESYRALDEDPSDGDMYYIYNNFIERLAELSDYR